MSLIELFNEIKKDNLDNFRKILAAKPNLINKYLYGATPFLYSIECSSHNIALELALNSNTDFELKDNVDNSSLEKAIENKMYKIVEIICKNSKDFNRNNIMENNETLLTNCLKMEDTNVSVALINGELFKETFLFI